MNDLQLKDVLRLWPRAATIPASVNIIRDGERLGHYKVGNLSAGGVFLSGGPPLVLESEYRLILN
jgi:hypothetical protein